MAAGDARALSIAARDATGHWVADLAPFGYFVTLTHRPLAGSSARPVTSRWHRSGSSFYTRVGLARHNRMVRDWFYDDVRRLDPTAQLWGETELHVSGQPHEHALLACAESAPVYTFMQLWFDRPDGGAWKVQPFSQDPDECVRAACYVEKAPSTRASWPASHPRCSGSACWRLRRSRRCFADAQARERTSTAVRGA